MRRLLVNFWAVPFESASKGSEPCDLAQKRAERGESAAVCDEA